jgi:hypothetical protein
MQLGGVLKLVVQSKIKTAISCKNQVDKLRIQSTPVLNCCSNSDKKLTISAWRPFLSNPLV